MKKILVALFVIALTVVLTGCTTTNKNTDNADSALIDGDSSGIMSPPVPPEPTRQ